MEQELKHAVAAGAVKPIHHQKDLSMFSPKKGQRKGDLTAGYSGLPPLPGGRMPKVRQGWVKRQKIRDGTWEVSS